METDSIFYGVGKIEYQAYQAIITDGTVYVLAYIAYLTGLWTLTFKSIIILFGVSIIVDLILTVYYAIRVLFPKTQRIELGEKATKVNKLVYGKHWLFNQVSFILGEVRLSSVSTRKTCSSNRN